MGSIEGFARQVREISKLKFGPSANSAVGLKKKKAEIRILELGGI